ncbi:MAG: hypothetical protein ACR2NX_13935 [Chthoniobacterales bacterium]
MKYFRPKRGMDFLSTTGLLATPPKYFTDRLEFSPKIRCGNPRARARKQFATIFLSPEYFENNPTHFPAVSTFKQLRSYARRHKSQLLKQFEGDISLSDSDTEDNVPELVSQLYGVICFSDDGLIPEMWEEYASSQTGLVVDFRQNHPPFTGRSFLEVDYSDERVSYDASATSDHERVRQFIRRKQIKYLHERESRLIVPLDITRPRDTKEGLRYFYPIEPELVISVTLGLRATPQFKGEVIAELQARFPNRVTLFEVRPGPNSLLTRVQVENSAMTT